MQNKYKILLLENIHQKAVDQLESEGHKVTRLSYAPGEKELTTLLKDFDIVGLRSKTLLKGSVLSQNPHLIGVGCFCIGTNQVDLVEANKLGIPVFNAPHSNTRSVAELVISHIISLSRQIGDRNMKAHQGIWDKSAVGAREVRGKRLGIVGYGHIGSQVSVLAEAMGLKVVFYDTSKKLPLGNAESVTSLKKLLGMCDFVSLHVPELAETKNLIGGKELSSMKKGSFLINASRGSVIKVEDLVKSLDEDHIAGCAIDVFPEEPASNSETFSSPLQKKKNVILTPHIGGSTEEAQESIALEVSESLNSFLIAGSSQGAVNFPQVEVKALENSSRLINVHHNLPGVLGKINNIISTEGININAQYLATDEKIGFLIVDVHSKEVDALAQKIKLLDQSIKTRIVY